MKNVTRLAAIIETPAGVLLVQDAQDKNRQVKIAKINAAKNRDKNQKIHAEKILTDGRFCLVGGKKDAIDESNEDAIAREINEEIGLFVEDNNGIQPILEMLGQNRDHLIYIVKVRGRIQLALNEVSGIGFLTEQNIIPVNTDFYQSHVVQVYNRYIKDIKSIRNKVRAEFMSEIEIPLELIENFQMDQEHAYAFRKGSSLRKSKKISIPTRIQPSPNLRIYNNEGNFLQSTRDYSLTKSSRARIIPPSAAGRDDALVVIPRKRSNPLLTSVNGVTQEMLDQYPLSEQITESKHLDLTNLENDQSNPFLTDKLPYILNFSNIPDLKENTPIPNLKKTK